MFILVNIVVLEIVKLGSNSSWVLGSNSLSNYHPPKTKTFRMLLGLEGGQDLVCRLLWVREPKLYYPKNFNKQTVFRPKIHLWPKVFPMRKLLHAQYQLAWPQLASPAPTASPAWPQLPAWAKATTVFIYLCVWCVIKDSVPSQNQPLTGL